MYVSYCISNNRNYVVEQVVRKLLQLGDNDDVVAEMEYQGISYDSWSDEQLYMLVAEYEINL